MSPDPQPQPAPDQANPAPMSAEEAERLSERMALIGCQPAFLGSLRCWASPYLPREELWGRSDACLALLSLDPSLPPPFESGVDGWFLAGEMGPPELRSAASVLSIGPDWANAALPGLSPRPIGRACWIVIESERFYLAAGEGGPKVLHKTQPPPFFFQRADSCPEAHWPAEDQAELARLCAQLAIMAFASAGRPWAEERFGLGRFGLAAQSAFERAQLELESAPASSRRPSPRV